MKKTETKDLNYYKNNCEEDYIKTPISVLRYISELEKAINYTRCCEEFFCSGEESEYKKCNEQLEAINLSGCCKSDSELLKAFLQYVNCSDTDSKVSFDLLDKYLNSL